MLLALRSLWEATASDAERKWPIVRNRKIKKGAPFIPLSNESDNRRRRNSLRDRTEEEELTVLLASII